MATVALKSAGTRTCQVTVQARTASEGTSGFPTETWNQIGKAEWMARETALSWDGQGEQYKAGQFSARSYDIWHCPYRADLDPELVSVPADRRLLYRSTVFDIVQAYLIGRIQIVLITLAKVG